MRVLFFLSILFVACNDPHSTSADTDFNFQIHVNGDTCIKKDKTYLIEGWNLPEGKLRIVPIFASRWDCEFTDNRFTCNYMVSDQENSTYEENDSAGIYITVDKPGGAKEELLVHFFPLCN